MKMERNTATIDDPYKYERLLISELKKINNDRDFIFGVLSFAGTEENFKICLDFIKQGIDVTEQNLQMLSLDLDKEGPQADIDCRTNELVKGFVKHIHKIQFKRL